MSFDIRCMDASAEYTFDEALAFAWRLAEDEDDYEDEEDYDEDEDE